MYSLAPAWIAATAARASVAVPQATIGAWIRSASSAVTSARMSIATSTINKSAPRPERNTASAWSVSAACVTSAPFSIAILVAGVSWPLSVPTIRRRMSSLRSYLSVLAKPERGRRVLLFDAADGSASRSLRLDDFRHGDAEFFFHQHDLATGDQAVIDVDVDRLADLAVEFEHGAGAELEEIADIHSRAAEHGGHLDRHIEHRFEIGGDAVDRSVGIHQRRRFD